MMSKSTKSNETGKEMETCDAVVDTTESNVMEEFNRKYSNLTKSDYIALEAYLEKKKRLEEMNSEFVDALTVGSKFERLESENERESRLLNYLESLAAE